MRKTPGPDDRGQRSSDFHPGKDKQVTQAAGTKTDPPARRSASVPADSVPPFAACLLGPYTGMDG